MDGLLVGDNDTGSNGFPNGDNVKLVISFGTIRLWCFSLIMPSTILDKKQVTDVANFSFPNSTK